MPYCGVCKLLTIEKLDNDDFPFHANLAELKLCAEQTGCPLCHLGWTRIQQDWAQSVIDACLRGDSPREDGSDEWDPQLYLRGQLLNLHDRYPAHESCIWMSCGPLSMNYGLAAQLNVFAHVPPVDRFPHLH